MKLSAVRASAGTVGVVVLTTVGLGVAQPASAATSTSTSTSTSAEGRCAASLPPSVLGDPGVHAGESSGARLWHDGAGWHLRFTHPGSGTQVFTGVVTSGQPITARGYKFEKHDSYRLSNRGRTLTFTLVNHGAIDGIDFTDRCAINTAFAVARDGHRLAPVEIWLGAHRAHPTSNPFLVQRHR